MGHKNTPGSGVARGFLAALAIAAGTAHPAWAGPPILAEGDMVLVAIATGAVALAVAAGLWALAEQRESFRLRRLLKTAGARLRVAVGERDALLEQSREALLVWGRDGSGPYTYGSANALFESCLKGPDALAFSKALDDLCDRGTAFSETLRDDKGRTAAVRGRAVGGMVAVWISLHTAAAASSSLDFGAVLDALPVPVWLRDKTLNLVWGNRAFLKAAGAADMATAQREQVSLEKSERDLAAAARAEEEPQKTKRYAVMAGQRRALDILEVPTEAGVVGAATDITDMLAAEASLRQHIDAHTDTLDKLATAVAMFGRDQKLAFFNQAYARLWGLPEDWLDTHPSDGEVLDRLREGRKLPEQRDYQSWKREWLKLYETARDYPREELWHVPGGKTLRVVAQPHPFGGLTFLYEDVTERITLESSYNTLIKVQSATLDTLAEGVAVFGPDGRLKLSNAAFARIWRLSDKDLAGEPHVRAVAAACAEKFGEVAVWEKLIQSVASGSDAGHDMGIVERNDRSILSLTLSPLPDGALLITFADVTDRFRIETVLRERAEALEAADRLKSEFVKHASYELRTPLNAILGFAELLSHGTPGPLNRQQSDYVQNIVTASNTLTSLVSDIFDLAMVESGALRLELERVDLNELMDDVTAHARDWAQKAQLTLRLDCPPQAGVFLADKKRVRQIVFNLLSNAIRFTPNGGEIVLGARIEGEDVQIFVQDNGPGIAPEVRPNVFERFSAQSIAGQRGGAGLGLALVNRFVELHDGWVEIESDDGTLVRCHFPRRIQERMTA